MPVIITPAFDPATTRPAQDPQWVVRPWSERSSDQACLEHSREDEAVLHWQALVDAGLIPVLSSVEGARRTTPCSAAFGAGVPDVGAPRVVCEV